MRKQKMTLAKGSRMGLRQRWLFRTAVIACVIGTLCVLLVTSAFARNLYASRETEILEYVQTANAYFDERVNKSEEEYYDACVLYTQTCDTGNKLDLQLVDPSGKIVSSSSGMQDNKTVFTTEVGEAIRSRGVCTFAGQDPVYR